MAHIQRKGLAEYQYEYNFKVTENVKNSFQQDGAFIVRNLLSKDEVAKILQAMEGNKMLEYAWDLDDGEGRGARMLLWNHPGNDITGMMSRSSKVVDVCEQVMGGEVYHYHTKLMMKEAKFGGKFNWHQDFGYWYNNGCLKPDMLSVFIPLDKCTKENGCLQMIPGTHLCGRIDHSQEGGQTVCNQERVDLILKQKEEFPLLYLEMEAGDAAFFHCNVLHRSDKNDSDKRRWAFVIAYNMASNNPVLEHNHPQYTPLKKVDNDAIMKCNNFSDFTGKDIMDTSKDKNIKATHLKESKFN